MKLLILGGVRFLGKELVKQALELNHEITVISLDPPEFLDKINWINVNRNNQLELEEKIGDLKFDCVIDNIALHPGQISKLLSVVQGNVKRYILTSTVDIYLNNSLSRAKEDIDQNLDTNIDHSNHVGRYVWTKRNLEKELRSDLSSMEKIILRPCNVMGPYDNVKRYGEVRSLFYPAKLIDNGPVILYHTDVEIFSLAYVKDVVSALLLLAEHPDAANRTFNVAGDTVWTTESLIDAFKKVQGSTSKVVRLHNQMLLNNGLVTESQGWNSVYGFTSGIHRVPLFDNSNLKSLGWNPSPDEEMLKDVLTNVDGINEIRLLNAEQREKEIAVGSLLTFEDNDFIQGTCNLPLSSIAIGTHRGEESDEVDDQYRESLKKSITSGINVIDTAINYRNNRSERVVGSVISDLVSQNIINRSDVFVITKGGYLPNDHTFPLLTTNELKNRHSIRSSAVRWSIDASYKNLKLKTVDLFLLHNPELALSYLGKDEFYLTLTHTFSMLEHQVRMGRIKSYGIATWTGLISKINKESHLDLHEVLKCAKLAANSENHHFTSIEIPLNVTKHLAVTRRNQIVNGELVSSMEFARHHGLNVFTSNSIEYGDESENVACRVDFDSALSVSQKNLLFVKSTPGVTSAIVGMKRSPNVESALEVMKTENINDADMKKILAICSFKTRE